MSTKLIICLSTAGVFVFLFVFYLLFSLEMRKIMKRTIRKLAESYSDENLKKMEYDIASYHAERINASLDGEEWEKAEAEAEEAIFARVADKGIQEIRGTYNPEQGE